MTDKKLCWLALGSNLPHGGLQPQQVIRSAITSLKKAGLNEVKVSGFYRTAPVPRSNQPDFINCVIAGETNYSALEMLDICQSVEMSYGRERAVRWDARTLDIDIINFGQQVFPSLDEWHVVANNMKASTNIPHLVLPHPFMHRRAFVLRPLCDLMPEWRHPVFGRSASDLLSDQGEQDRKHVEPVEVK